MSSRIRRFPVDQQFLADLLSRPLADHDQYKVGTSGNDKIHTGRGNDVVDSGEGNDRISTGRGNDVIDSGEGNDRVSAGRGNDVINTGAGNDRISAGSGDDIIMSGPGNDRVDGGSGFDTVVLEGSLSDYDIHVYARGKKAVVTDLRNGYVDHLVRVESLEFDDAYYDVKHRSVEYKIEVSLQIPSAAETNEDVAVAFTADTAPVIAGADPAEELTLQIATANGLVGIPVAGVPNGAEITLTGTADQINALLKDLQFEPAENYNGTATISYELRDSADNVLTDAQQSVAVASVNDAPDALFVGHIIQEDQPYTFSGSDFIVVDDSDNPPNNLLAVKITTLPDHGAFTLDGSAVAAGDVISADDINAGKLMFTPEENRVGSTSFTYQVQDDGGTVNGGVDLDPTPNTQIFQIQPVNDAPVANNDSATTEEDTPVNIAVLANDSDIDSAHLTVLSAEALNGTVAIESDGTLTYTPNADFNGDDTITYTIIDGNPFDYQSKTANATVAVTVTPVDDAPVADAQALTTDEDTPIEGALTATDVDGEDIAFAIVADSELGGTVTAFDPDTGAFIFTPDENFSGEASFQFTATAGTDTTSAQTITIDVAPVADAPNLATSASLTTDEDVAVTINLSVALVDTDGSETLDSLVLSGFPEGAVFSLGLPDLDGNWVIEIPTEIEAAHEGFLSMTPPQNYSGSFTLTVAAKSTDTATLTTGLATDTASVVESIDVTVNSTNVAPLAIADTFGADDVDVFIVGNGRTYFATNNGDGSFAISSLSTLDRGRVAAAAGDVNDDGDIDVFVPQDGRDTIWFNDGTGSFIEDTGATLISDSDNYDVELADIDGDGDLDAIVASPANNPTRIWLNDGNGNFQMEGADLDYANTPWTFDVAVGDLDGDGDLDIVEANFGENIVWLNQGGGVFDETETLVLDGAGTDSRAVSLADLNGDNVLDIFIGNMDGPNTVWISNGDPANPSFTEISGGLGVAETRAVALGDLNGDGTIDAFVGNSGMGGDPNNDNGGAPNEVWFNDGQGNFTLSDNNGVQLGNYTTLDVELFDIDGDGDLDALTANNSGGQPNLVWLNDGQGNFTMGTSIGTIAATDFALADFDADSALSADAAYVLDVLANDADGDATDTLTIESIAGGDIADALAISADGSTIEFDPSASDAIRALGVDELRTYTFEYTISDGQGGADTATAQVTVRGVNDAPVASSVPDPFWSAGSHSELDLSGVFSDPEGDTLTYAGELGVADSWIDIDPNTGVLSADPTSADQGAHEVTVTATDTDGLSTEVHFTIHVIDLNPIG
jgi:large repetitive protein